MDLSKLNKTLLYIDSNDREPNSSINDFVINLELPRSRIRACQVHSIELPNIIYPVRTDFNNTFQFIDTGDTTRTITLQEGSYDIETLMTTISTKMSVYAGTYVATYSNISYKFKISQTEGSDTFQLLTSDTDKRLWKLLGFSNNTSDLTGSTSYTAPSVFNLSAEPSYCYVKSNLIRASKDTIMTTNKRKKNTYLSCLCKVPLESAFGEYIHFRPYIPLVFEIHERSLSQLRFWLEDDNSNLLPMERNWSIGLILYTLHDEYSNYNILQQSYRTPDEPNKRNKKTIRR